MIELEPLTAVSLLAAHLRPHDVVSLLAEATHKRKAEVELSFVPGYS